MILDDQLGLRTVARGHQRSGLLPVRDTARHFSGDVPKAPPPPTPTPAENDPDAEAAKRKAAKAARDRQGRSSLITNYGGESGDTTAAPVNQKTLLGG